MSCIESSISNRYLSQDDRIEIADGLAREETVTAIAKRIGKSFQSVYKEIARNRKPDGRYQPWYAHNQAHQRRRRPKVRVFAHDDTLRRLVADKLGRPEGACRHQEGREDPRRRRVACPRSRVRPG
ncbi:helix-turn-helix domain-containing protein [Rhodococcus erythropolis]|uniref:helix-turn-helix domain-containing protein n=1 Tax=Rhodococcus erythropolis TaxID=1833 RepID=UPI00294A7C5B|nr:helix-turn-helix domain-containing protein [Rhodococcus erythropolis]MDV6278773.1 helix-turn-helix domain-containing protein [Rhodococcus erythropolis]